MVICTSEKVDDDSALSADVPNQVEIGEYPSEIPEGRVILTWIAPKENGAVITEYIVYQREVNENGLDSDWGRKPTGQVVLQHEVIGLKSGKMYEFQVTAKNRCGESAREKDKTVRVKVLGKFLKRGFKLQLNENYEGK